jgi:hypothetical protein
MSNRFADAQTAREVIYQAIGAGSVCWENLSNTGTFQSEKAFQIGKEAIERLNELGLKIQDYQHG